MYGAEDGGTCTGTGTGTGAGPGPPYAQRRSNSGCQYQDYQSAPHPACSARDGDDFYVDVKKKNRDVEMIKSESDFMCPGVESSGSYKCIKCCKVGSSLPFKIVLCVCVCSKYNIV